MEEEGVLSGDNAFNAHFGECIAAIGDIDDDGYPGQFQSIQFTLYDYFWLYHMETSTYHTSSWADEIFSVVTVDISMLHYSKHI